MVDKIEAIVVVVIVGLMAFIGGAYLGGGVMDRNYQKQAIERGYAEHNAVTGEWQWKETKGQPK